MSDVTSDPNLEQTAKKRKRSGKERQQRKAEAIAAAAAATEAEAAGPTQGDGVAALETKPTENMGGYTSDNVDAAEGQIDVEPDTGEPDAEPVADVFDLDKVQGRIVSLALHDRSVHALWY
jgi:hypothetical protein